MRSSWTVAVALFCASGALVISSRRYAVAAPDAASFHGAWITHEDDGSVRDEVRFAASSKTAGSLAVGGKLCPLELPAGFCAEARLDGESVVFDVEESQTDGVVGVLGGAPGSSRRVARVRGTMLPPSGTTELLELRASVEGSAPKVLVLKRRGTGWEERYHQGSQQAEAALIEGFRREINEIQRANAGEAGEMRRGFHAKGVGLAAELRVVQDLPQELRAGMFEPGAVYPALVRFSNASGKVQRDGRTDMRGIAIRAKTGKARRLLSGETSDAQDFLMTNGPVSHARDAEQFMFVAKALVHPLTALGKVGERYGVAEAARVFRTLFEAADRPETYLVEDFWSRAPIRWGPLAVKLKLEPVSRVSRGLGGAFAGDKLREDLKKTLARGEVAFDLKVQLFLHEKRTPIEDGSVRWQESEAPFVRVARLVIPKHDIDSPGAKKVAAEIEEASFSPWNASEEHRPLGSLMRARREVYKASAELRRCPFGFGR